MSYHLTITKMDIQPPADVLVKYKMYYEGGCPEPGHVYRGIMAVNLFITKNMFVIKPECISYDDLFAPIWIPFNAVVNCEFKSHPSGLNSNNEIHITYEWFNNTYIIRLSSQKIMRRSNYNECQGIIDFIRCSGIFAQFKRPPQ